MKWGNNKFVMNHECHAFSYFQSNFKSADYLTLDGRGEIESCTYGKIVGVNLKIGHVNYPHSLDFFILQLQNF